MPSMTRDEIEELLRAPEVAVLSTVDTQGRPEGTPVWFEYDGERIRVLVHRDSKKARNIRGNANVSLTVDTRRAPYRGVVLSGTAELSGPDPTLRRRLATRYLGERAGARYVERTAALDRDDVLIVMSIARWASWDYSKGD